MSKNGLILLTPTSIAYSGTSATISANGSVEFSACTELRLNGVFSADYDNYTVVWRGNTSGPAAMGIKLSSGGVDETGSNYARQFLQASGSTVSAPGRVTGETFWYALMYAYNVQKAGAVYHFYGPHLAQPTAVRVVGVGDYNGAIINELCGTHSLSSSYDGFNFYLNPNNASGRIAVYGMVK